MMLGSAESRFRFNDDNEMNEKEKQTKTLSPNFHICLVFSFHFIWHTKYFPMMEHQRRNECESTANDKVRATSLNVIKMIIVG